MKLLEVLVLLAALALFVWWQLRDLAQAQKESARQPEAAPPARADAAPDAAPQHPPKEAS